jgi:thymidylate synthase (FAD)
MKTTVKLIHSTPVWVAADAARTCTDTNREFTTIDDNMELLLKCKDKEHESVLEHIVFTFKLQGFSRGMLQELARHRIASLSVMSSRWCLRKLLVQAGVPYDRGLAEDFLVFTDEAFVNGCNMQALNNIVEARSRGIPNDKLKYMLPEAFKTKCVLTINLRSFRNMVNLRTSKRALKEFQNMVHAMLKALLEQSDDGACYFDLVKDQIQEHIAGKRDADGTTN